jgi:protein O-mannosyl-transferase
MMMKQIQQNKKKNITNPPETKSGEKFIDFINRHFNIFSIILIISAGFIVYSNSFDCTFHFDDQGTITDNPIIKNLSNFENFNYWQHPARQIAYLSFGLNYHFNKLNVFGYHLVNIFIHIITGIFSFLLIKLILNQLKVESIKLKDNHPLPLLSKEGKKGWFFEPSTVNWIALFSALFFIVHPLQTQAVTYIVQRMASMAAMFYILSIYLYALGRIEHVQKNKIQKALIFYILALMSGIFGFMTKENAVTFPLAMLLFEFFFIRNKKNRIYSKYVIFSFLAIFIIFISYLVINSSILTTAATSGIEIRSIDYLINQFVVIIRYLQLTILPINQSADYGNIDNNFPFVASFWRFDVIGCLLLLIGLMVLAIYLYHKNKVLSFGIFWLFLTLSIESSIIPIADPMFEHRMYLPMLGLGLFLISSIFLLLKKIRPIYIFSLLFVIIVLMGFTSYSRNEIWKNDLTLWSDVIKKAPYNDRGYSSKGLALGSLKRYEEANKYYDEAVKLNPENFNTWNNKGEILDKLENYEAAVNCYDQALKAKPDFFEALNNKGKALNTLQKYNEALDFLDEAVKLKPDNNQAWYNKGISLAGLKKYQEAIDCYDEAIKIKPDYYEAWNNKGNALNLFEKYDEALICYERALELKDDLFFAWNNKGRALFNLGRYEEAISCYNKAIDLKPDYQNAINNKKIALENLKK